MVTRQLTEYELGACVFGLDNEMEDHIEIWAHNAPLLLNGPIPPDMGGADWGPGGGVGVQRIKGSVAIVHVTTGPDGFGYIDSLHIGDNCPHQALVEVAASTGFRLLDLVQLRDWTDYNDTSGEFERWLLAGRPDERGRVALHA
jgi:hypothetical protein